MQYFTFFIINVFVLAVFYLIFSLKLERNASEFREKKLRKVMDEIMTEFNLSAERNISIFEKKIDTLKKLLKRAGEIKSVDISLLDDDFRANENEKNNEERNILVSDKKYKIDVNTYNLPEPKKSLKFSLNEVINSIKNTVLSRITDYRNNEKKIQNSKIESSEMKTGKHFDLIIEKDINELKENLEIKTVFEKNEQVLEASENELTSEKITDMFNTTSDKYSLIVDLHKNGHKVDDISKFSGIPISEIRLVLNLNF